MAEFLMPSLGADMERGTVVRWFVRPGDRVKRGDIVAEVETQKGVIDVEIFRDGEIAELLVGEGDEADVGAPLAIVNGVRAEAPPLEDSAAAIADPAARKVESAEEISESGKDPKRSRTEPPPSEPRKLRVSPAARSLASELGVDLEKVTGTGPGGAVGLEDVRRASSEIGAESMPVAMDRRADQLTAMREVIAKSMSRSKREIPHYYLGIDIDMKPVWDWLAEENRKRSVAERLLYAPLLIKAVARAVRHVPEMNGFWVDGEFRPSDSVHVGVAISLRGGGLVAPAIHDADLKSLDELMEASRDLVMRARTGKLRGSELSDPTITVTSLGEQGVDTVYGVIYPPQVAIVGFGSVVERPWNVNGAIGIRPVIRATLSGDHRASVGHTGGVFLGHVNKLLMKPGEL
jgi:pyruvate dehydrogenase E2 component (dihydrolipoamide acetyltransferase)